MTIKFDDEKQQKELNDLKKNEEEELVKMLAETTPEELRMVSPEART